ncbi:MAG TPA: HAD-IIIA family hydrolase [Sedimentisphaerales bacterium]|nr:HAD-IIIA family hydrolase [Sedimentisphaerales bacterium]
MSNKAIFLDRDDTLIEDPGYINHPDQVKLLDGVAEALIELKTLGYMLIVATNQSAVARGIVTEKVLGEIHDRLKELLAEKGAYLDQIYYCPYHPDGAVAKYRKESDWRKPNPGMLLAAAGEMDIDLGQSWLIGNGSRDIDAGLRAGCKTILVSRTSQPQSSALGGPKPDYKSVNIREAVNIIKKHYRLSNKPATQAPPIPAPQAEPAVETPEEPTPSQPVHWQPEPVEPSQQQLPPETTEQLLRSILEHLRSMQRADMFSEFSVMRLMAGVLQIIVLFCLLVCVWLLMAPNRQDNSVFIALGFAVLLQLMSLTFYVMQGRK